MTVLFFLQVHSVHQVIPVRVMGKASPIDGYIIVEGELVILSFMPKYNFGPKVCARSFSLFFQIETHQRDGKVEYRP